MDDQTKATAIVLAQQSKKDSDGGVLGLFAIAIVVMIAMSFSNKSEPVR